MRSIQYNNALRSAGLSLLLVLTGAMLAVGAASCLAARGTGGAFAEIRAHVASGTIKLHSTSEHIDTGDLKPLYDVRHGDPKSEFFGVELFTANSEYLLMYYRNAKLIGIQLFSFRSTGAPNEEWLLVDSDAMRAYLVCASQ